MRHFLRDNGLSLAVFGLFLVFLWAESIAGFLSHNEEQRMHHRPVDRYLEYVSSGEFIETSSENWESEFLEMAAYVVFTAVLIQKGSAESKSPDDPEAVDRDPRLFRDKPGAPWPVRRGGWVLKFYERSLAIAFLLLFVASFAIHAAAGVNAYNDDRIEHGWLPISAREFLSSSHFWYQSFQNWQSEFLGLGCMVVLSIFLRQRGSPESKPVDAPHSKTGKD